MQDPVNMLAPDPGVAISTLVAIGLLVAFPVYLLIRWLRAYERRSPPVTETPSQAATIAALEAEVASLRTELAELTTAQDFTMQLLDGRSSVKPDQPRA